MGKEGSHLSSICATNLRKLYAATRRAPAMGGRGLMAASLPLTAPSASDSKLLSEDSPLLDEPVSSAEAFELVTIFSSRERSMASLTPQCPRGLAIRARNPSLRISAPIRARVHRTALPRQPRTFVGQGAECEAVVTS